jgi:Putative transmembrane protein (PGPGW)
MGGELGVSFDDSLHRAKRLVKIVVGFTALLLGVIMLVTPGPGIPTIIFGLVLLAAEFVWAQRLLNRLKAHGNKLKAHGDKLKAEGHRLRQMVMPSAAPKN